MMSIAGVGGLAIVHDDDRHATFGDERRHVGIALQAPDVVDDCRAPVERPGGDARLDGVDRDRQAELDHRRQHRLKPRQFLVGRNRLRAAIGPGRFRADVEDVGALLGHGAGVRDGLGRIDEVAAVGKGIRGDVEDAHDHRPPARKQRGEAVAGRLCRGSGLVGDG